MTALGPLVGDVGGTTSRFARCDASGAPGPLVELRTADHDGLESALRAATERLGSARDASIAVAGPIDDDEVELTNAGWRFSIEGTRRALGLDRLHLANDFAAVARSLPELGPDEREPVRPGTPLAGAPWAVLGPGTGLGVAALIPTGSGWIPVPGEGGHRDLAATTPREWQVVERLARRFGHVSAERALSGPGLVALYETVCELDGLPCEKLAPREISAAARAGAPAAVAAGELFAGWLGAVAGDLALTVGARGGVALAGGVLRGLGPAFLRERFVERFLAKGRFADYLEPIPIWRLIDPVRATLRGAAKLLG